MRSFQRQIPPSLKFSLSPDLALEKVTLFLSFRMPVHLLCFISLVIKKRSMFYIIYSEATVTLLFLKNCVFYLIVIDLGVNTVFISLG